MKDVCKNAITRQGRFCNRRRRLCVDPQTGVVAVGEFTHVLKPKKYSHISSKIGPVDTYSYSSSCLFEILLVCSPFKHIKLEHSSTRYEAQHSL